MSSPQEEDRRWLAGRACLQRSVAASLCGTLVRAPQWPGDLGLQESKGEAVRPLRCGPEVPGDLSTTFQWSDSVMGPTQTEGDSLLPAAERGHRSQRQLAGGV